MQVLRACLALTLMVSLVACPGGGGSTGNLQVVITGLPSGVNANVVVTKPDSTTQTLTVSTTLSNVPVGTYTVAANPVTSGSTTYNGTVSGSPANVTAGATATVNVTYSSVVLSCPNPAVFDDPLCKFDDANTKFGP